MGMAASQARLLSLTSRLHDIELKAQNIMSQKIALSTQKDALYQDYCEALDASSIKVAFWDGGTGTTYVDANYSTLCNYNPNRAMNYALKDNKTGNLIVSQDVKDAYESFGGDKYTFAWSMMGMTGFGWEGDTWTEAYESGMAVGYNSKVTNDNYTENGYEYADGEVLHMTECEADVYEAHQEDTKLTDLYEEVLNAEDNKTKQEALNTFREYLYKKYDSEIFDRMNINKYGEKGVDDEDKELADTTWDDISQEFNYYANLWTAIDQAGGCQVVEPQYESGEEGNEWFNNMIEAGQITIQVWDTTGGKKQWSDTSVATSTNQNYLQEMPDDKDLKKAEAEYEHELDIINRKDTKFDTELNKLETQRSAITTEIDSIKKVKDDNIDRTFGIFS